MTWLSIAQVAERLNVSPSHARDLAQAADYAAEVRERKRALADVPPRLRPLLDSGFPRARRVGARLMRVNPAELERWLDASPGPV